jgi:hypothetical protein
MLSACLLPLLLRAGPSHPLHDLIEFGQLRHVQLLQPRGEVVRFATQIEVGTRNGSWTVEKDTCIAVFEGESTEPVAKLAVGASIVPYFTWTVRPAWYLVELPNSTILAVLEPRDSSREGENARSMRLLSFPGGEELVSIGEVEEIEDAIVRGGRFDRLLRRGGLRNISEVIAFTKQPLTVMR